MQPEIETPVENVDDSVTTTDETADREFDKNPTILYALIQKKLWSEASARAKSHPNEARAFIVRKEKDGSIRWRLLPIHAAIVFKAPVSVIESLLTAYPEGAKEKDDQEMLPLHLAFRNGACEEIVGLLLVAFPESVNSPDRKGRFPLTLAKNAESPNREMYIAALEKGASHYFIASLALARDRIMAEQKALYDAKIEDAVKLHQTAFSEMSTKYEKTEKENASTLASKDNEIAKLQENAEVLADHVASLEAQMGARTDTERFLAVKIAKLEMTIKDKDAAIEEHKAAVNTEATEAEAKLDLANQTFALKEESFNVEIGKLNATIEGFETDLQKTKEQLAASESKLQKALIDIKDKEDQMELVKLNNDAKFAKVEIDWANAKANVSILESQLKKKSENEHFLASQVANLAGRLAETADSNMEYSADLKKFEEEKADLEATIHLLKMRLADVTKTMQSTRDQQIIILDNAVAQEEQMAKVMETHAAIVNESIEQEKKIEAAKAEMMALVEKTFESANTQRLNYLALSTSHGNSLKGMDMNRTKVLSCAQTVSGHIVGSLEKELNLATLDADVQEKSKERRPSPEAMAKAHENMENLEVSIESFEGLNNDGSAEVEVVASPKHVIVAKPSPEAEPVDEERTEDASMDTAVDTRVAVE